jgi:hypothetical protein
MEISEEQYARIKDSLPVQRGNVSQQMLHAIARARERWGLEFIMETLDAINRTFSSGNLLPAGAHRGTEYVESFAFSSTSASNASCLGCGFENNYYFSSQNRDGGDRAPLVREKRGAQTITAHEEQAWSHSEAGLFGCLRRNSKPVLLRQHNQLQNACRRQKQSGGPELRI